MKAGDKSNLAKPSNSRFRQGYYQVKNPHKYIGDETQIIYRSSWEKKFFEFLDNNQYILAWSSETISIPYMKPCMINGNISYKKANYYPDVYVEFIDEHGNEKKQIIEIKPKKQTKKSRSKNPLAKLQENFVYEINMAKWAAAEQWCKANGIEFKIATEKSIFR